MHVFNLQLSETAGVIRLLESDALALLPARPAEALRMAVLASLLRELPDRTAEAPARGRA